jgi:hypothetical protein
MLVPGLCLRQVSTGGGQNEQTTVCETNACRNAAVLAETGKHLSFRASKGPLKGARVGGQNEQTTVYLMGIMRRTTQLPFARRTEVGSRPLPE